MNSSRNQTGKPDTAEAEPLKLSARKLSDFFVRAFGLQQTPECLISDMPIDKVLNHIRLDDSGIAWIDDTRVKVIGVAMKHLAHGWSSEEINRQHPTLSLAQVYAALSFYYDHQSEFDDAIFESAAEAEQLAAGKTGFTWSPQIARDGTSALCEPHHEFDTFCGRHLSVFPSRTLSVFARGDL